MCKFIFLICILFSGFLCAAEDKGADAKTLDFSSQEYVLGAGDMLRILVYGSQDLTTEARISATGTITFPLLGELKLGGLTPTAAEKKISDSLEKGGLVKQPHVNLVVLQYQSQYVSVLGDVYKPGRFSLDRPSTLSDALALAGGATPNGSDIVTLIRTKEGKTTKQDYDLRELLIKGKAEGNPMVVANDIVFVNAREVSVLGQVNRPGKYSVIGGVRTVLDFLSQAGGISSGGADKIIVVTQRAGNSKKYEIDVDQLYRSGDTSVNFELSNGDSIYVPRAPVFYIYGEVQRPGSFRLERNMTVAQGLSVGGGLTPRGTERGIKIKRLDKNGALKELDAKASDMLQMDDVIVVSESLF